MGVIAATIGALMAVLDISIVNSSLPVIQGEIGASGTEGSWVATSYLIAEIVMIPLTGWFTRLLGMRNFLLIAAIGFTFFSMVCGFATSLPMMIIGRIGQGFIGGAMIPTVQPIIASRLPPHQQPMGISILGLAVLVGPLLGPVVGGWLTENISWHYAFFLNLPVCIVLVSLLLIGLPGERFRGDLFREADWLGIAGLAMGVGGLTFVLEQGPREDWFASKLLCLVSAIATVGFLMLLAGQRLAKRPVVKLSLLLDRQFGSVAFMALAQGVVLFGAPYAIPQFLSLIAGYNALQAGYVVIYSALAPALMIPLLPILMKFFDIRVAVSLGFVLMAIASFMSDGLTAQSDGMTLFWPQVVRGAGSMLIGLFLIRSAIQSVASDDVGDASGLFNCIRNLGGSFGLAAISILQDQRVWLHARRLEETMPANSVGTTELVQTIGLPAIAAAIDRQALVMAFNDIFYLMGWALLLVVPLVFFLRPLPQGRGPAVAAH